MNFKDMAEQNETWIIEQRRYFHAHPELSFEEKNTTQAIGKRLEEMGLTPHFYPDYNGLWAMIEGGKVHLTVRRSRSVQISMPFPSKNTQPCLSAARIQVSCMPADMTAISQCSLAGFAC